MDIEAGVEVADWGIGVKGVNVRGILTLNDIVGNGVGATRGL